MEGKRKRQAMKGEEEEEEERRREDKGRVYVSNECGGGDGETGRMEEERKEVKSFRLCLMIPFEHAEMYLYPLR